MAAKNALAVKQPQPENPIVNLISRAACDPTVDVEKLERLIQMQNRELQRAETVRFDQALSRIQGKISQVATDANNDSTKSRYASYSALDKAVRPFLDKERFGIQYNTGEGPAGMLRVMATLSRNGVSRNFHFDVPLPERGAKDNAVMNKTHATVAAFTYGQRTLLRMMLNIAVGKDDDGNYFNKNASIIDDEQLGELISLADRTDTDKEAFCKLFKIDGFAAMPLKRYEEAKALLHRKIRDNARRP